MSALSVEHKVAVKFAGTLRVAVFLMLLLDSIGLSFVRPVAPALMEQFTPHPISDVSSVLGVWIALYSIALFLTAPLVGQLSDTVGRRPVLLLCTLGAVIDYAVAATTTNVWVFFAARALAGVCAGGAAAVQALIADVTTEEDRAQNFALVGTAFGLGMIIGPPLGGLLGYISPAAAFAAASCLSLVVLMLNYFVLPETMPSERRRTLDVSALNPLKALLTIRGLGAGALVAAAMLLAFGSNASDATMVLFVQARLGWTTTEVGTFLSAAGIAVVLSKVIVTRWSVRTLGEHRTIVLGLLIIAICQFLFAGVRESWHMYAILVAGLIANAAPPTLYSALSRSVAPAQVGQLMGALMSWQVLLSAIAAPVGTGVFSYFNSDRAPLRIPGAAFVISGVLIAVAVVVLLVRSQPTAAASGDGSPSSDVKCGGAGSLEA